ncbi:Cysteine desulfurase [Gemella morbillorum]|uniref:cysteine desulfurase family protein n=1 Tax=Gemella morbillorum TaxID=29391 RepID=UPI000DA399F3|nr:cysteine desulfurase family protein [Gemella morbillorum]UBH79983.1 cysteine desulfurase [Gemella morbillorum]SQH55364.1 Cysteine desulfurase [Gemella morbillorum]
MIYLDNCATTKPYDEVLKTFVEVNNSYYGNPASINKYGKTVNKLLNAARTQVADILGVESDTIYFTSCATESNNIALLGSVEHKKDFGNRIIVSRIEHPSVLETFRELEHRGFILDYVNVDENGFIDLEHLKSLLTKETILVSVMHVNNIFGAIQPIEGIVEILKEYPKIHFHVDGVQGVLKEKIDLTMIDSYSISAHKFHGLKGVGALYLKSRRTTHNITFGGGQENGLRSGTVNVPGAVSLAKALRLTQEKVNDVKEKHYEYKKLIVDELSAIEHVIINSPLQNDFVDSIINISLPKIKGEAIINALNERGIMVSTTSACSSRTFHLNEALYARGLSRENIEGSIRVSFSYETKLEEVKKFIEVFKDEYYKKFKEVIESGI